MPSNVLLEWKSYLNNKINFKSVLQRGWANDEIVAILVTNDDKSSICLD